MEYRLGPSWIPRRDLQRLGFCVSGTGTFWGETASVCKSSRALAAASVRPPDESLDTISLSWAAGKESIEWSFEQVAFGAVGEVDTGLRTATTVQASFLEYHIFCRGKSVWLDSINMIDRTGKWTECLNERGY